MAKLLKDFGTLLLLPGFAFLAIAVLATLVVMVNSSSDSAGAVLAGGTLFMIAIAFLVAGFNLIGAVFYFVGHQCICKEREIELLEARLRLSRVQSDMWHRTLGQTKETNGEIFRGDRLGDQMPSKPKPDSRTREYYERIDQLNRAAEIRKNRRQAGEAD